MLKFQESLTGASLIRHLNGSGDALHHHIYLWKRWTGRGDDIAIALE